MIKVHAGVNERLSQLRASRIKRETRFWSNPTVSELETSALFTGFHVHKSEHLTGAGSQMFEGGPSPSRK